MDSLFDLSGRVAVVVGGSSGLGREIAIGLAQHGADVIPVGRSRDSLTGVYQAIEKAGRKSALLTADVSDRTSLEELHREVIHNFNRVDILVNAAGFTQRKATASVSDTEWAAIFDTNLQGMLRTWQVFHSSLEQSGEGRIINIASLGSYVAFQEVAAYCASKSAVLSLTRSLGCEWATEGICVNAIAPGVFPTDLNRTLLNGTNRGREILLRTPMRRFGRPEELVGAAVFLSSRAASFMTGQSIIVDGGYLASGVNS